jgi:hypothetical protein
MPAERVTMCHAREIIRLKFSAQVPTREIARRQGLAASTVRETLKRFESSGLVWPLPTGRPGGGALRQSQEQAGSSPSLRADWPAIHRELKRKHVTLLIVWDEYTAGNPGGYSYSRFCELYRAFESKLSPTMRQTHAAGERLFVDYAADGVPVVIDRLTGEIRMAQVFVAVLGASSFIFARATWTQGLAELGAPAKICRLGHCDRLHRPGDRLALRRQDIHLPQLGDDLFGLVALPCHLSILSKWSSDQL